ncbi:hypothetical protein [Bacillus thuringiensis]|uniref:hypothetical protein n=1 Tax=Bacillus thuringiensis TaxID=1428 RepID=UPI0018CF8209|nr:hypothetical protein [Bacillus thuringiensis]
MYYYNSYNLGARPQIGTGAQPQIGTGAQPQIGTGAQPQIGTGAQPQIGTGAQPQIGTGAQPQIGTGAQPQLYNTAGQQAVNRFYEHNNGIGMFFDLKSGERLPYVGNDWNDKISSVHVAAKTLVLLYKRENYGYPVNVLENTGNYPIFYNIYKDFNDVTLSIKTFQIR